MNGADLGNHVLNLLLMALHLGERSDLRSRHTLAITQGNNLIKGKNELESVAQDLLLVQTAAVFRDLEQAKSEHRGKQEKAKDEGGGASQSWRRDEGCRDPPGYSKSWW